MYANITMSYSEYKHDMEWFVIRLRLLSLQQGSVQNRTSRVAIKCYSLEGDEIGEFRVPVQPTHIRIIFHTTVPTETLLEYDLVDKFIFAEEFEKWMDDNDLTDVNMVSNIASGNICKGYHGGSLVVEATESLFLESDPEQDMLSLLEKLAENISQVAKAIADNPQG
tara:strand:+ start:120 stop:620 length:501 start_codon:yes stop_codon:yes gene_type:complete